MTRPTTIDELPDYSKRGDLLVQFGPACQQFPELQIAVSRIQIMLRSYATVTEDGAIYTAPSSALLQTRLEDAQRSWDYSQRCYAEWNHGIDRDASRRWTVDSFARNEGLPSTKEIEEREAVPVPIELTHENERQEIDLEADRVDGGPDADDEPEDPDWLPKAIAASASPNTFDDQQPGPKVVPIDDVPKGSPILEPPYSGYDKSLS